MTKIRLNDLLDDDFEMPARRRAGRNPQAKMARRGRANEAERVGTTPAAATLEEGGAGFQPTFTASKHERQWIMDFLGPFYDDNVILDVLRKVKGGKEANVYCCQAHPKSGLGLIAAKVYRPRMFRQLRQDARYRTGRMILDDMGKQVRDDRTLRAIAKRTRFGQAALHTSWLEHEYQTLTTLSQAGADVPRPIARNSNTILMEYLGELDEPAPPLHHIRLERGEAQPLFDRLMHNVEVMLTCGLVHADLSAFNVLYWNDTATIIDFPQAVDVRSNPDAPDLLRRDVERLYAYFARYGVQAEPDRLARALWARHVRRGSAAERARQRAIEEAENEIED